MCSEKSGFKENWVPKKMGSKITWGAKKSGSKIWREKNWCPWKFGVRENFRVQRNWVPKQFDWKQYGFHKLGVQKFLVWKKFWRPNSFWIQKYMWSNIFLIKIIFDPKNSWGQKIWYDDSFYEKSLNSQKIVWFFKIWSKFGWNFTFWFGSSKYGLCF